MPRLSWPRARDLYLTHLRAKRCAVSTVESYRRELERLQAQLDPLTPAQVRLDDLRDYQVGLLSGECTRSGKPNTPATVHRIGSVIRAFYAFLHEEGRLARNPADRLERPKLAQRAPGDVLTIDEISRLLAAADSRKPTGLRNRALIELLYASGLRRAEALALDLGDLDRSERCLVVRHGKGDKGRLVPLTRSAWHWLETYLGTARPKLATAHPDGARAVFLARQGHRLGPATLMRTLHRMAAVAGIEKRVTPHTLRRTFSTHLHREGVSLRHIQALLGHAKLTTTALYLKLDARELREQVLRHHPRERIEP